jgi:hypothetical protein
VAGCRVPGFGDVLGVQADDVVRQAGKGRGQDVALLVRGGHLDQIRRVQHDAHQPGVAAQFVQQPAGRHRAGYHVGRFRLDAQPDSGRPGGREQLGQGRAQVSPGAFARVVRMPPPDIGRIAGAGAQGGHPRSEFWDPLDERAGLRGGPGPPPGIRIDHVVRHRDAPDADPEVGERAADASQVEPGQHLTRRDGGQPEAAEVELDQAEAGLLHGPGHLPGRVARERAGEDAQVIVHGAASGARAAHRSTG